MVTLPEPAMLSNAYYRYSQGDYRDAEYQCKKLLHYLPDFAPAHYLLGEVYILNGLIKLGIASLETAIRLAPWKAFLWGRNLSEAYRQCSLLEENGDLGFSPEASVVKDVL
jgi:tetratricopeptide (TPR) repeat protein